MLRASNRVLKPGGKLAFFVISLPEADRPGSIRQTPDFGPDWVDPGDPYEILTARAGFDAVAVVDVTPEYQVTLEGWIRAWDMELKTLEDLLGKEEVIERRTRRQLSLDAVREGLMRRYLVKGVK